MAQRIQRKAVNPALAPDQQPFIAEKEGTQPSHPAESAQAPLMSSTVTGPVDLSSYDYYDHPGYTDAPNAQEGVDVPAAAAAASPSDKFPSGAYSPSPMNSYRSAVPELSSSATSPAQPSQGPMLYSLPAQNYPQPMGGFGNVAIANTYNPTAYGSAAYDGSNAYGGETEKAAPPYFVPAMDSSPGTRAQPMWRRKKIIIIAIVAAIILLAIVLGVGLGVGLKKHNASSSGSGSGGGGYNCPGGRLCSSNQDCNGDTNGSFSTSTCVFMAQCGSGYCT